MKTKVAEALKNYTDQYLSLHMPGHKGGILNPLQGYDLFHLDITETEGSDDLYHPDNFLKESLDYAKAAYKTKKTYYLVNGSTGGLLTAISACTSKGDKIIIQRNAHHSVYNAITLNELRPVYLVPKLDPKYQIFGGFDLKVMEEILSQNEEAKVVVVTSPNYEGYLLNIEAIAELVHDHGKLLIVDEAHGAHFPFFNFAPTSSIYNGADIVVQSLHKTLPALTQTALLHICSDRVNVRDIEFYYSAYQTSSPSFVLVSSIDACIRKMNELHIEDGQGYEKRLRDFYTKCQSFNKIKLLVFQDIHKTGIGFKDLTRLVIAGKEGLISGRAIADGLIKSDLMPELISDRYVVAISTLSDQRSLFDYLYQVLQELDRSLDYEEDQKFGIIELDQQVLIPSYAITRETEAVEIHKSIGRIAGAYVKLYPPSIPLLVPGERISKQTIKTISYYLDRGLTIHGIDKGQITIVSEAI